ncbi:MAG: amino acid ABC transporter permease [Oscillospiraceae bacterium]|nr:amino acid ABC transporter permease [Oscillospiraceae bacterium]
MTWFHDAVESFANEIFRALIKDDRYILLLKGLWKSVQITLGAAAIGLVIGLLLAIAKLLNPQTPVTGPVARFCRKMLTGFANGYISFIRGTPAMVQLMVIYFVIFGKIIPNNLPVEVVAAIAFGINAGAYIAEIIRAGILAVDKGQTEAGRSLGLSNGGTMLHIVIPQAVKNVLPALGNEFIILLKETSIAGVIGVSDLTKAATGIGAAIYYYIVPLLCAAFIYFLVTTVLSLGMNKLEGRLRRSD